MDDDLTVLPVPGKGRGVVARRAFRRYEVVESASVVVLSAEEWAAIEGTILGQYAFRWGDEGGQRAMALSIASFFNHSYTPNTCPKLRIDDLRIDFLAMDDIAAGDELTFNYNGRPSDNSSLWFMPAGRALVVPGLPAPPADVGRAGVGRSSSASRLEHGRGQGHRDGDDLGRDRPRHRRLRGGRCHASGGDRRPASTGACRGPGRWRPGSGTGR